MTQCFAVRRGTCVDIYKHRTSRFKWNPVSCWLAPPPVSPLSHPQPTNSCKSLSKSQQSRPELSHKVSCSVPPSSSVMQYLLYNCHTLTSQVWDVSLVEVTDVSKNSTAWRSRNVWTTCPKTQRYKQRHCVNLKLQCSCKRPKRRLQAARQTAKHVRSYETSTAAARFCYAFFTKYKNQARPSVEMSTSLAGTGVLCKQLQRPSNFAKSSAVTS
jgi:hypothetical protein